MILLSRDLELGLQAAVHRVVHLFVDVLLDLGYIEVGSRLYRHVV